MSAGKERGVRWRQIGILIRSDIYEGAELQCLDISYECNAALAHRLGMEYPANPPSAPVVSSTRFAAGEEKIRPVINADDPTTPAKVKKEKKEAVTVKPRTVSLPVTPDTQTPPKTIPPVSPAPFPEGNSKKPASDRKKKTSAIKRFVTTRIVRSSDEGGTDTIVPKDELYQRFTRWCRENAISPVPDRRSFTVALKNQYAIPERSVGGEPYWVNIRLK
jgi:hypothetical protein